MKMKIEPTLYIIMRTDLPDCNPGKSVAQGSHATNDFEQWKRTILQDVDHYGDLISEFERWQENRSFGRCIVLEGTKAEIEDVVRNNDFAGMTVDPTYPWRNWYGDLFLSEEVTCGWCFICNETTPSELLTQLPLHR